MGSQKKKKKKKKRRKQERLLAPLRAKLMEKGVLSGRQIVLQPSGETKMSEVLLDFIEPYSEQWETEEELDMLLSLGLLAWNAALFSGRKRRQFIKSLQQVVPPDVRRDMSLIIKEMIQRKDEHFAANRRMIVDFQLTMTSEGPHLSVASTLLAR